MIMIMTLMMLMLILMMINILKSTLGINRGRGVLMTSRPKFIFSYLNTLSYNFRGFDLAKIQQ